MKKIGLIACCAAMALHGEVFTLGQIEVVKNVGGVQKSDTNVVTIDEQQIQKDEIKRLSQVAYSTPGVYVDKKGPRAPSKISTFAVLIRAECRFLSTEFRFTCLTTATRTTAGLTRSI